MATESAPGKGKAARQVPPMRKRGRPPGPDADRPRRQANTRFFTELILIGAQLKLGRPPTAPEIEAKLGIGRPTDATGLRSGANWKNMRRDPPTATVTDERLLQLCSIAIEAEWMTTEQLEQVQYALASHAAAARGRWPVARGPNIADLLVQRRQELTEFQAAKLATFRALTQFLEFERKLKRSQLVDHLLDEFSEEVVSQGVDTRFFKFDANEVLERLGRLELQFLSVSPRKPRMRKPKVEVALPPVSSVEEIDAAFKSP